VALAAKRLPEGKQERQRLVLLYECADYDRNIVGGPDQELLPVGPDGAAPVIALGSGETVRVPPGLTPSEVALEVQRCDQCEQNTEAICEALRAYARAHKGVLPPAAAWCDGIEPYLRRLEAPADVFVCPGAPQLRYGYALNEAPAGADVKAGGYSPAAALLLPSVRGVRNDVRAVPATVSDPRHWDCREEAPVRSEVVGLLWGTAFLRPEGEAYD